MSAGNASAPRPQAVAPGPKSAYPSQSAPTPPAGQPRQPSLTLGNKASALALLTLTLLALTLIPAKHAAAQTRPSFGGATVADQVYIQRVTVVNLTLPAATSGTPPLTYNLAGVGGATLNLGLTFDAAPDARVLSGTPTSQGTANFAYTVVNSIGIPDTITFRITVLNTFTFESTAFVIRQTYTAGTPVSFTLPAATGGTPPLTYQLTPFSGSLPAGLAFDTTTHVLSGTPTTAQAQAGFSYTVTDSNSLSGSGPNLALTILEAPPVTFGDTTIAPQSYPINAAVNVTLPAASDGYGTLSYAINSTPALPTGLAFDGATRVLSGTAPATPQAAMTYTYTATDMDPAGANTVQLSFTIAIRLPFVIDFTGDTAGTVTEGMDAQPDGDTSGTLTVTNSDPIGSTDVVVQTDADGDYGLFSIAANGDWTYALGGNNDNLDATHALAAGATVMDTFTVTAVAGGTRDVVITITGVNDTPSAAISEPADGMDVDFGAAVTLDARNSFDPDTGTTLTFAWSATPNVGSFADATAASTTWTAPASGTDPVTLTLTATDDDATTPLTGTAAVTVNPVAAAVTFGGETTGAVTEDAGTTTATGQLTLTTSSNDKNVVVIATTDPEGIGTYGTFSIAADTRIWTYTLNNADVDTNALPAGVTVMDTFTVTASANPAATVDVTITVTGANDAPNADAGPDQPVVALSATVTLDGSASADPDTGDTIDTYAWTQDSGTNVILSNVAMVSPTFTAPDSAGELVFSLVVSDGDLDSAAATVTITVVAATANIDGNTEVNHLDGLVMYLSLNPVFMSLRGTERFRNELMGHLTTSAVGTTQELVANAEAWRTATVAGSDVDGVGGVTHLDGLVIYLSLNPVFRSLRSTERFRNELMGHLTTTEVATTQELVDNANALLVP